MSSKLSCAAEILILMRLRDVFTTTRTPPFFSFNQSLRSDGGKQGTNLLREKRNLMKLEMTTGKVQMAQSCTSHLSPLMI